MRLRDPRRMTYRLVFIVPLVALSGCAVYVRPANPYRHRASGIEARLPIGWLAYTPEHKALLLTRDGLRLESMSIRVVRVGARLDGTDRVYQAGMLPDEVAELSLGLFRAGEQARNFRLERIESARLAGADGYRAEAVFAEPGGLPMRLRAYGAIVNGHVCEFWYAAEQSVYFRRHEDDFESTVASATLTRH